MYWEEVDLCRRVKAAGKKVVFNPKVTMIHEREGSTDTRSAAHRQRFAVTRHEFMKKHFGGIYAVFAESWFTLLEEWRLVVGVGLVNLAGVSYFLSEAWLGVETASMWLTFRGVLPGSIATWYWLGLAGAVMSMIGWYNESNWHSRTKATLISVLVGFLLVLISPIGAGLTILGGLVWGLLDAGGVKSIWRRLWIRLIGILSLLVLILLIANRYGSVWAQVSSREWRQVATRIKETGISPVRLVCMGCQPSEHLEIVSVWLGEMGVPVGGGKDIYIVVPPWSDTGAGVANTYRYRVGRVEVAIPIGKP